MNTDLPLLRYTFRRLQDQTPLSLTEFAGRVILVVNTASQCLFTRQYSGLEKLYECYKDRGLVVLGFPSDDFAGQEFGTDVEISAFCEHRFNIQFPIFTKTRVKGLEAHEFYRALFSKTGSAPRWNFHKYVIYPDGETVKSFGTLVFPNSRRLIREIEAALALM